MTTTITRPNPNEIFPKGDGKVLNSTAIRDWPQSNLAAAMNNKHVSDLAPMINRYYSNAANGTGMAKFAGAAEVGGGTVPRMDMTVRRRSFFDRLRETRELMPNSPLMALVRSDAGAGMEEIAPDLLEAYIRLSYNAGMDVFRNFHALNDARAHVRVHDAVQEAGGHFQAAFSWAVFAEDPTVYNPQTVVTFFKELKALGMKPHSYALKDPSGVLTPPMARFITRAVKEAQRKGEIDDIPFGIHSHNQAGWAHESCMEAFKAGANFADAAPTPGGYGAQAPMPALFEEAGECGIPPERRAEAMEALHEIDAKCKRILMAPSASGGYMYNPLIRQDKPDPTLPLHGVAGGQSSAARQEMIDNNVYSEENWKKLLALIPQVRKEAGVPVQVTPGADYIIREARRRLTGKAHENFYCGYNRLLTGEMGPTKEPAEPKLVKQALLERVTAKLKQSATRGLVERSTIQPFLDQGASGPLGALVEHLWDLSTSVRDRDRIREISNRIGELMTIQHGDRELRDYMEAQLATTSLTLADGTPVRTLDDAILRLSQTRETLKARVQSRTGDFTDEVYDAFQRPAFKAALLAGDPADPLLGAYEKIRDNEKVRPLLDAIGPKVAVKLIRNAGLTTVCMGEVIPKALGKVRKALEGLHDKGLYHYPADPVRREEDEVIYGMLSNSRAAEADQFKEPMAFFAQRDKLTPPEGGRVAAVVAITAAADASVVEAAIRAELKTRGMNEKIASLHVSRGRINGAPDAPEGTHSYKVSFWQREADIAISMRDAVEAAISTDAIGGELVTPRRRSPATLSRMAS